MLKFSDDLTAVGKAFQNGEVTAEGLWMHVAARLESVPEREVKRILNLLEVAVYGLSEPERSERIAAILSEASLAMSEASD